MSLVKEAVNAGARQDKACALIGLSVRTLQRWQGAKECDQRTQASKIPANKLSTSERTRIVQIANSAPYADLPPSQIVPRLADQGIYLASESTFYRVLNEVGQLAHRASAKPATLHRPQACVAAQPNQVWSWDITYLATLIRGLFFYLYMMMDIYSRKVVGWAIHDRESSEHAARLIEQAYQAERVSDVLLLHSDNGSPMKGATLLATLERLGVIPSFSRPGVSNDNPYSESLFRTLKYRPLFPACPFKDIQEAIAWVCHFVQWYNHEHRHSRIRFVTPVERHSGLDGKILAQRKSLYQQAKRQHPDRWSGNIRNWDPIGIVLLNPVKHHATHP